MNFLHLLSFFFIYAFIGWCLEVIYATLNTGTFINRGLLNGPHCPIYGFGMLIVIGILHPFSDNPFILFFVAMIACSILEFIAGFLLEKIFHKRLWDYSDCPYNIKGYICLRFSILWGLGALMVIKIFHPFIIKLVNFMPRIILIIFVIILSLAYILDIIVTMYQILSLRKNYVLIQKLKENIRSVSDDIGLLISKQTVNSMKKIEELKEERAKTKQALKTQHEIHNAKLKKRKHRLLKAYPRLKPVFDKMENDVEDEE